MSVERAVERGRERDRRGRRAIITCTHTLIKAVLTGQEEKSSPRTTGKPPNRLQHFKNIKIQSISLIFTLSQWRVRKLPARHLFEKLPPDFLIKMIAVEVVQVLMDFNNPGEQTGITLFTIQLLHYNGFSLKLLTYSDQQLKTSTYIIMI